MVSPKNVGRNIMQRVMLFPSRNPWLEGGLFMLFLDPSLFRIKHWACDYVQLPLLAQQFVAYVPWF